MSIAPAKFSIPESIGIRRLVGAAFFVAAVVLAVAGVSQLHSRSAAILPAGLVQTSSLAMLLAAVLIGIAGWHLITLRFAGFEPLFLLEPRFFCYAVAGIVLIFVVLGFALAGNDAANIPCRSLCALWFGLCVSHPAWPRLARQFAQFLVALKIWHWLEIAAFNVVISMLLVELILRFATAAGFPNYLLANHAVSLRMRPGTYPNGLQANSLGFPGPEFQMQKPPGKRRIAALGDSFSVGIRVAYEDNYLTLLEKTLPNTELYNFGVCATGPRDYRILLSSVVWAYGPDLVILPLYIGNDITAALPTASLKKMSPDALQLVWFGLRVYRVARERFRLAAEGKPQAYQCRLLSEFSAATRLRIASAGLDLYHVPEFPALEARWRDTLGQLDKILDECRSHKVPLVVLLLPEQSQVDERLLAGALCDRGWRASDVDISLPQRRLTDYFRKHDIPCLDLLGAFAKKGRHTYYPNDEHWNVRGNHLAAETVADWFGKSVSY